MNIEIPAHILVRLEIGFSTDSARLKELEQELTETLQGLRHFGLKHGPPDDWNATWDQQWDQVEAVLRRIRVLVNELDGSIESSETDRLQRALKTWNTLESEDASLVASLGAIRTQATDLNAAVRREWNILARKLETHLEIIHACGQALRIKLELLKEHTKEEVDKLVDDILAKLPNRTPAPGLKREQHDEQSRKAAAELKLERHKFLGFTDVLKGLLLWVETTEERERKNLSLEVEPTHHGTPTNGARSFDSEVLVADESEKPA